MEDSSYIRFRGKCKPMCEDLIKSNPELTLVRGHYIDPFWGEQPHWWAVDKDGVIYDPTAEQFPSKGHGEYIEFSGFVDCSECGKTMKVKLGQLPYDQIAQMIEQGLADLYLAHEKSTLRDETDREWVDNFVYEVYSEIVRKG